MNEFIIKAIKDTIDDHYEKETVFWDGEYFYSREHCTEISYEKALDWATNIAIGWIVRGEVCV